MPTTNNNFSTLITAIDTKAQSLAASTTDPKDLVYLGKTLEALNVSTTVADVITQGDTQVTRVTTEGTTQVGLVNTEGTTQVAAVQSAASGFATQANIDTSIAALVDSAPGTLNTLNELAAALGDDASFSTTVTNSIATKLPLAGGTMTGNVDLGDNVKARFGTGNDLEIYHDGSNSRINSTTGTLYIKDDVIEFVRQADDSTSFKVSEGGSTELYHNHNKKFETTSSGATVTGTISDTDGDVRAIPQSGSDKTSSYTLTTGDIGNFVGIGSSGSITVPNSTFSTGDAISIFNNTSGDRTITCSITTAYIGGENSDKASVTLATRGVCTILFISGTVCVITGNVS